MKKLSIILVILTIICNFAVTVFANEEQVMDIYANNIKVASKAISTNTSGEFLIPMRCVFEAIGAHVSWDEDAQTATATMNENVVEFSIGFYEMKINDELYELNIAPLIFDEKTYIPLSVISNEMGVDVKIDKNEIMINVPITFDEIVNKLSDKEKSWMDITTPQYLEDFDYLYNELCNNYPYYSLASRTLDLDIPKEYQNYRLRMENCTNDWEFTNIISEFIDKFHFIGHISSWGIRYSSELEFLKNFVEENPDTKEQLAPYIDKLDNPISQKNYKRMESVVNKINSIYENANVNDEMNDTASEMEENDYHNVETKIVEQNKIAYLKINSFDMSCYAEDRDIISNFFLQVKDYPHLIIDITENGGGGMNYFNDLIVAPLISKPLTVETYMMTKGGENNRFFLQMDKGIENGTWKPISIMSQMENLNKDDKAQSDYFMTESYTVEPSEDSTNFKGKIWLLVSSMNYSSSEYAAMFSKFTNFATLVGETTSGDGIGVDPAYIILPNSGIVVQYSPVYGIAPDGRGSEEFGTEPHIISPDGETALETCLKEIINSNK